MPAASKPRRSAGKNAAKKNRAEAAATSSAKDAGGGAAAEAPEAAEAPAPRSALARPAVLYVLALVSLVVDQATKLWTVAALDLYESVPVIDGWFAFTYVLNEGAAFSVLSGQVSVLLIVTALISVGIVVYERLLGPRPALHNLALGLILGGAVSNLIDRFRLGAVIDMLDLQNGSGENIWPIFNVADIVLVVGIGLMAIAMFRAPHPPARSKEGADKAANKARKKAAKAR